MKKHRSFLLVGAVSTLSLTVLYFPTKPPKRQVIITLKSENFDKKAISMVYYVLNDAEYRKLLDLNSIATSIEERIQYVFDLKKGKSRGGFFTGYEQGAWSGQLPQEHCLIYCSSIYSPLWIALCSRGEGEMDFVFNDSNYLMSHEREKVEGRMCLRDKTSSSEDCPSKRSLTIPSTWRCLEYLLHYGRMFAGK